MTHSHAAATTPASSSFRPWTERSFQAGAGITVLAIFLFELTAWGIVGGAGLRILALLLAVTSGIVLAVWAARRPEAGAKRSGAFTLSCAIIGLLAAGAFYLIGQVVQYALSLAAFGPAVVLTTTLAVFGAVSLVTGVIKRINA